MRLFTRSLLITLGYAIMAFIGVFLTLAWAIRWICFLLHESADCGYALVEYVMVWVCIWDKENRQ